MSLWSKMVILFYLCIILCLSIFLCFVQVVLLMVSASSMVTLTMSDVYSTSVNGILYDSSLHTDIKREVNNHTIVYHLQVRVLFTLFYFYKTLTTFKLEIMSFDDHVLCSILKKLLWQWNIEHQKMWRSRNLTSLSCSSTNTSCLINVHKCTFKWIIII